MIGLAFLLMAFGAGSALRGRLRRKLGRDRWSRRTGRRNRLGRGHPGVPARSFQRRIEKKGAR